MLDHSTRFFRRFSLPTILSRRTKQAQALENLLSDSELYLNSDADTRRQLLAQIARFAAHHRLSAEQAAHLWKDRQLRPTRRRFLCKGLLVAPLLLTLTASVLLFPRFAEQSALTALFTGIALFGTIWEGFSLILEGGVRRLFPSAKIPVLHKEKAPPICAMLVASAHADAIQTVGRLEMLIAANPKAKGLFGLILILPDAPAQYSTEDEALCEPFLTAFRALEEKLDRPLRLAVCRRSYLPREKHWKGAPSSAELLGACHALLCGEESLFGLTVGSKAPEAEPQALYIAPADATLSPDGLRLLAATLFHPLTDSDCLLPILRSADRTQSRVIDAYTKRQITLQKAGSALPYSGYGMIGLSALARLREAGGNMPLSCALASTDLHTECLPASDGSRRAEVLLLSALPTLRIKIAAVLRLPLYLTLLYSSPVLCLCGILLSDADLIAELLAAVGSGMRFSTHTLPTALRLGREALDRLLFPVRHCFDALPFSDRLGRPKGLIGTLSTVGAGIAVSLLCQVPQAIVGLIWAAAPLLSLPAAKAPRKAIPAAERRYLLALCKRCWAYFERTVSAEHPLPPSARDGSSSDTTPDAFSFYLIACLCACDLGLIDRHTLESRLRMALDAWERLPLYNGLPYDRYSLETGDGASGSRIDTASCGRYALSMALLSAGLAEYAVDQPSLAELSRRAAHLWQRADYTRLYDSGHSAFYEAITPSGDSIGRLDLLASPAECICIAALALGQLDPAAWKGLRRPAKGNCPWYTLRSQGDTLEDHLLPALFLESNQESLLGRAQSHACLTALKERSLSPRNAALMLPFFPMPALHALHRLERVGDLPDKCPNAMHSGQTMAAVVNALGDRRLSRRLMRLPAFASLAPLLNEPYDRLEPSRRLAPAPAEHSANACTSSDASPSIVLAGDSRWGVLWAEGRRMRPFYRGKPMGYPASPSYLYDDGHFSGLLLFCDSRPIDLPALVRQREDGGVTLSFQSGRYALHASLTLPEEGLLELTLTADGGESHLSALFCFCPPRSAGMPFWLETINEGNILLIRADGYFAALSAEGLDRLFIRAEDAPLPLGEEALPSLLERTGNFTEGGLLSPACRIGGRLGGTANCRFRLAFGESRAAVLSMLKGHPSQGCVQADVLPPLPGKAESALERALSLELGWLLKEGALKAVVPSADSDAFSPHLRKCLDRALDLLQKRGFETALQPYRLASTRDLPADQLLRSCLPSARRPSLTSPPLPERTRIRLTEGALTIKKGKDLPPVGRIYGNHFCAFDADSYTPALRFWGEKEKVPLCLTMPAPSRSERQSAVALFYAASEVCYGQAEVRYIGEGYSVCAHLSGNQPLLVLEVTAPFAADLRLTLGEVSSETEDSRFWHRDGGTVVFCTRILREGKTIFLLGSFERASDRRYYQIREEVSGRLAGGLPLSERAPYSAELTWQSKPPYPAPLLIHPALAAQVPEAFPLLLFFEAGAADRALVKVFEGSDPLPKVSACLLWAETTENIDFLREKISYSTPSGRVHESIYLASARALDLLIEASPDSPLLARLLDAFAALARRMGDHSGETLYREKLSALAKARTFPRASDSIEALAERLLCGDRQGVSDWKRHIDTLALFPSAQEGSALWSLFWYGILGYRETPNAFILRPIACALLEGAAFTLRKKDTLYRIRITFSASQSCLLDGKACTGPFLFDKKEHFLEITVEKSARMV